MANKNISKQIKNFKMNDRLVNLIYVYLVSRAVQYDSILLQVWSIHSRRFG